jgi:hypothetical protein
MLTERILDLAGENKKGYLNEEYSSLQKSFDAFSRISEKEKLVIAQKAANEIVKGIEHGIFLEHDVVLKKLCPAFITLDEFASMKAHVLKEYEVVNGMLLSESELVESTSVLKEELDIMEQRLIVMEAAPIDALSRMFTRGKKAAGEAAKGAAASAARGFADFSSTDAGYYGGKAISATVGTLLKPIKGVLWLLKKVNELMSDPIKELVKNLKSKNNALAVVINSVEKVWTNDKVRKIRLIISLLAVVALIFTVTGGLPAVAAPIVHTILAVNKVVNPTPLGVIGQFAELAKIPELLGSLNAVKDVGSINDLTKAAGSGILKPITTVDAAFNSLANDTAKGVDTLHQTLIGADHETIDQAFSKAKSGFTIAKEAAAAKAAADTGFSQEARNFIEAALSGDSPAFNQKATFENLQNICNNYIMHKYGMGNIAVNRELANDAYRMLVAHQDNPTAAAILKQINSVNILPDGSSLR